jgi:hypothetical protein
VALQATRDDRFVESRDVIGIAGAVDPPVEVLFFPIAHGQFEEPVSLPIEVGLTFATGTHYDVDWLGMSKGLGRRQFYHGSLEVLPVLRSHFEMQVRVPGLKVVGARNKLACNGLRAGQAGCQVVGGSEVGSSLFLMTGTATRIADEIIVGRTNLRLCGRVRTHARGSARKSGLAR